MHRILYINLLAVLLVACKTISPISTATEVVPTGTVLPVTVPPANPSPEVTPTPKIEVSPGALRMAYVLDGNLFIQNGQDDPVQLTFNGADINPRFSTDGGRLLFYRNPEPLSYRILDLYSIHPDGTGEKLLVTGDLLETLGLGYNQFTEIAYAVHVPGTHQVLFGTDQLNEEIARDPYRVGARPNQDILSVDMDTGEITVILPPGAGGNFVLSPNGAMLAVQSAGHINVLSIDGQMIHQDLVTYTPSTPFELIPGMFWSQDSTELLVTLPIDTTYEIRKDACNTDVAVRSLRRYPINAGSTAQIDWVPPLIGGSDKYRVSPDRNWILYPYYHLPGCGGDETIPAGLYLGSVLEGTTRFYASNTEPFWGPDNTHFIYDLWEQGLFLGSVDQAPVSIDGNGYALGWIDATHYFFYTPHTDSAQGAIGEIGGEITYFPIGVPLLILEDTARQLKFDFIYLGP